MDPLSISASIIAILTASQKISSFLGMILSKSTKAPAEMLELKKMVDSTHGILSQLQRILLGQGMLDPTRPSLVLVDQVVVTLTVSVKIFAGLDVLMQSLNSNVKIAILDRVRWATKTNEVKEHLEKLEMQKSSLTLILTILTCESIFEANSAVGRLEYLVTQIIERHEVMAQHFSFPSRAPVLKSHLTTSLTPSPPNVPEDAPVNTRDYELDLVTTKVYTGNRSLDSDSASIGALTSRTGRISISRLSLAEVPNIGDVALYVPANLLPQFSENHKITSLSSPGNTKPCRRPVTLIASTQYEIKDWAISVKRGIFGMISGAIERSFAHHDLIRVIPCFGDVDYPVDTPEKSFSVLCEGDTLHITTQNHRVGNVTYILLDCPEFRLVSSKVLLISIAEIMKRSEFDQYLVYEMRSTLALLYLLPRTVPCCYLHLNVGPQPWQNIGITDVNSSKQRTFRLEKGILQVYFEPERNMDLLFMIASYLRYHQSGHGFINVGSHDLYDQNSSVHRTILRAGLTNITHITFPDTYDLDVFDPFKQGGILSDQSLLLRLNGKMEQEKPDKRRQLQEWANLDLNPQAQIFAYVGPWTDWSGVELITKVLPAMMRKNRDIQVVCVGPMYEGGEGAENLETAMRTEFPSRSCIKLRFTSLPGYFFEGPDFALLTAQFDHCGSKGYEFAIRGIIGIGSSIHAKEKMPGFWFDAKTTKPENFEKAFKRAVKAALKSSQLERTRMRAVLAQLRYPVAVWRAEMDEMFATIAKQHS